MSILQSKKLSPFGKYYVVEYFKRIEFQHRGSPHAHILLWLNNAPIEAMGNDKIDAITLIDNLISVSSEEASVTSMEKSKILQRVRRSYEAIQSSIFFDSDKSGNGDQLANQEIELIESRLCTVHEADTHCPHAIRLFNTNHAVNVYNKKILDGAIEKYNSTATMFTFKMHINRTTSVCTPKITQNVDN
ncbi:ATP-dependent DNA helicase [Trichonephila clavipes]|nr:ATP-dependent DNA helicase [Trichonephila clavipes]